MNVIAGSLGGAGVFDTACFPALGDAASLGAASVEWTGIARLVSGAGWAASGTVKQNVAAQPNSKR